MFGSKRLIASWDAFHLFIKREIGVVGFALFCYFFPSFLFFFLSLSCKKRVREKNPHMPPACVCPALSSVPPSLSPQFLLSSPVAPDQESGDPSPIPLQSLSNPSPPGMRGTRALGWLCLCCPRVRSGLWDVLLPCPCPGIPLGGTGGISCSGDWERSGWMLKVGVCGLGHAIRAGSVQAKCC